MKTQKLPNLHFEKNLWKAGHKIIAGADEVGRGCFAGPVYAAAVVWPQNFNFQFTIYKQIPTINDSKKLSASQREVASGWIKEHALSWGVGEANVSEINKLGIGKATNIAFRRAIKSLKPLVLNFLLVDAFYVPYVSGLPKDFQKPIIKGDTKSISIAAASIIAKVHRDQHMVQLNEVAKYKQFNWARNKGYGTKEHQEAILKHGISDYHRKQFVETWLSKRS